MTQNNEKFDYQSNMTTLTEPLCQFFPVGYTNPSSPFSSNVSLLYLL